MNIVSNSHLDFQQLSSSLVQKKKQKKLLAYFFNTDSFFSVHCGCTDNRIFVGLSMHLALVIEYSSGHMQFTGSYSINLMLTVTLTLNLNLNLITLTARFNANNMR